MKRSMSKKTVAAVNLLLAVLILLAVNLVSSNAFFRADMTENNAYSLSQVSRESLAILEDPLRVKVFFSGDVPAPYNSVRQYLFDLLREYDQAEDPYFSYETVDVTTEAGRREAQQYGLRPIEIQEIRSDQFQSKSVYMGAAVLYGNVVETVNELADTTGLEYRLTMAIRSAITQVDTLAGAVEPVEMTFYATPALGSLGIEGFEEVDGAVLEIFDELDAANFDKLEYSYQEVSAPEEIDSLVNRYGMNRITWENDAGIEEEALLEIIISYEDRYERVPVRIVSTLFSGYRLEATDSLEERISESLRGLVSASPLIAYSTGNGEKPLNDMQRGAGSLRTLLEPRYRFQEVNLSESAIPAGVTTLIVNGPTEPMNAAARYRIDQFLLRGGSLLVFLDSHIQQIPSQQAMAQGAQPSWRLNETGLADQLSRYGATVTDQIVLDDESFVATQGGRRQKIFQAPFLQGDSINRESVITRQLEDIILFNTSEILAASTDEGRETTVLLQSSPQAWSVGDPQQVGPWVQGPPDSAETGRKNLGLLLEGTFQSDFEAPVEMEPGEDELIAQEDAFLLESVQPGKLLVLGSSSLTTPQLLDPQNRTPNGTMLFNAVDYLNGTPGFAELRSKGLGVSRLSPTSPAARTVIRVVNTGLLPTLVVLLGLVIWARRRARRRRIREHFSGEGAA